MKIIFAIISIFSAYGIYTAVMLNEDAQAAAVVEALICGIVIYRYLRKKVNNEHRRKNRLQIFYN